MAQSSFTTDDPASRLTLLKDEFPDFELELYGQSSDSFPSFSKLPAEVRIMIWHLIRIRKVALRPIRHFHSGENLHSWRHEIRTTSYSPVPITFLINCESRKESRHCYRTLTQQDFDDISQPFEAAVGRSTSRHRYFFDPKVDTLVFHEVDDSLNERYASYSHPPPRHVYLPRISGIQCIDASVELLEITLTRSWCGMLYMELFDFSFEESFENNEAFLGEFNDSIGLYLSKLKRLRALTILGYSGMRTMEDVEACGRCIRAYVLKVFLPANHGFEIPEFWIKMPWGSYNIMEDNEDFYLG